MINILEQSKEFDKVQVYMMTLDSAIVSMKDVPDGTELEVDGFITFEDMKEDGTSQEICSILTTDKKAYAFQSKTFYRSLVAIHKLMDGEGYTIVKRSGISKSGRPFIDCSLKY